MMVSSPAFPIPHLCSPPPSLRQRMRRRKAPRPAKATLSSRSSISNPRTRLTSPPGSRTSSTTIARQKAPELLNAQLIKLDDRAKVLNDLSQRRPAEMKIPVKTSGLRSDATLQVPDIGSMAGAASVLFSLPQGRHLRPHQRRPQRHRRPGPRQAAAHPGGHREERPRHA